MSRPMIKFADLFQARVRLNESHVVKRENRYFLLNENLKALASGDFFYAGVYLGKTKGDRFFPSFPLLSMIAGQKANKVFVDDKSEWLFVCGRDVFKRGVTKSLGSISKGRHVLVLNKQGECLGFGKIVRKPDEQNEGVLVKNILDIGDFLRRER